jgi:hypothetical protein
VNTTKKKPYKKIAFVLSAVAIVVWSVLGTGASLAWFTDSSPELHNVINIAQFDLDVSYRLDDGSYKTVEMSTDIFDDRALYEPGYVQVVVLKYKNNGDVPFDYKTNLTVTDYVPAVNVFGDTFKLQDYLKFGVITADTEAELNALISERNAAEQIAASEMPLNTFTSNIDSLDVGEERFMAIVVRMPKEVGNIANFDGITVPEVHLGLIVTASQKGTLD